MRAMHRLVFLSVALFGIAAQAAGECPGEALLPKSRLTYLERKSVTVKGEPLTRVSFPYPQSPVASPQIVKLAYELKDDLEAKIYLAYFPAETSIIPADGIVESVHAILKYLYGYYFLIGFESP